VRYWSAIHSSDAPPLVLEHLQEQKQQGWIPVNAPCSVRVQQWGDSVWQATAGG